jgi:protein TonB
MAQQMMRTVRSVMDGARMLMPRAMPARAAVIDDGEMTSAVDGSRGVDGGVPGGVPNGVIHSIVESARVHEAPPMPVVKEAVAAAKPTIRLRAGGNVQEALLVHKVIPVYPLLARQARIEGQVVFAAVISTQGTIQSLRLRSGHPLLVQAATEAVRQWRYRPTLLNGEACEVDTVIEVNFTLNR